MIMSAEGGKWTLEDANGAGGLSLFCTELFEDRRALCSESKERAAKGRPVFNSWLRRAVTFG